ncbi:AI-2E family transporter [Candidatus Pacearchaeota archaeon]|nr:AI-2E family transporter [Candidatus Pacearchaeota archaeon]
MSIVIIAVLVVLSFFLVRPILLSIVVGFILAFIFNPVYNKTRRIVKSKNLSSILICILLIITIIIPLWFLTPILINQSIKFYVTSQNIDFVEPIKSIFPSLFASEIFSAEVGSVINSFVATATNSLMNTFSKVLLNFPTLFLQFLVAFFTFFFVLKDKDKVIGYIQSLLPFSKEVEKKLFKSSKDITFSVIYGQIIIGVIQGILTGIGFFIFGAPNALLFTFFAILAGIFPIIGTAIIWVPVAIYLFIAGDTLPALGIMIFGFLSSIVDNLIRPVLVSRRTTLNPGVILIGMIGGLFLFGVLGFILGPLILAYLFIVLEIYRNKKIPGVLIEPSKK